MIITEGILWFGALVTLLFGVSGGLAILQNWATRQIRRSHVTVVVYKDGKKYRYFFSTVNDAATNAIERVANGERVAYIKQYGEKIWDPFSKKYKYSLVKLSGTSTV